jgi:hypothetical protein
MTQREKSQIERINALSATARTSWLALLAFLAYVGITLLAVQDADFFVPSRRTDLPLVGISIPTFSFFLFAPPLAAALYIYLHIHLLRLWDAIADAPKTVDDEPLGEHLHPWIAKDYALGLKGGGALRHRPLRALGDLASLLLVWAAGPAVLGLFWWRSATAHDDLLTLATAVSFFLALRAGLISLWHFRARLKRPGWGDTWDGRRWKVPLLWLAGVLLAVTSWLRTEAGFDHYVNGAIDFWEAASGRELFDPGEYPNGDEKDAQTVQEEWVADQSWLPTLDTFTYSASSFPFSLWLSGEETWSPLAAIDFAGAVLVPLPADWRTPETARAAFRETWCRRQGLDMAVCDHIPEADRPLPSYAQQERDRWCEAHPPPDGTTCASLFAELDERFRVDWKQERTSTVADLPKLDLSGRDLRRISAPVTSLVGVNLIGTRLEGADLTGARLEGAKLRGARLEGAILGGARLEEADLSEARLEEAYLGGAWLEGAILSEARLGEADLRVAGLEGAHLIQARLEGADLRWARLVGADLSDARLEGADLTEARLDAADLGGARLEGAILG